MEAITMILVYGVLLLGTANILNKSTLVNRFLDIIFEEE